MNSNDVQVLPAGDETSDTKIGETLARNLSVANSKLVRVLVPWICDVLLSDRSIEAYGTDLVQFATYLEKNAVSLEQVTADHVRVYKAVLLRSGARPGTVARKLSVLRGAYREFADKGIVSWPTANAISAIKSPPINKNSTPALSAEQAGALLDAVPRNTLQGIRDLALVQTFFMTGCRVTAICGLRVGDVQFDGSDYFVSVREKRGKGVSQDPAQCCGIRSQVFVNCRNRVRKDAASISTALTLWINTHRSSPASKHSASTREEVLPNCWDRSNSAQRPRSLRSFAQKNRDHRCHSKRRNDSRSSRVRRSCGHSHDGFVLPAPRKRRRESGSVYPAALMGMNIGRIHTYLTQRGHSHLRERS